MTLRMTVSRVRELLAEAIHGTKMGYFGGMGVVDVMVPRCPGCERLEQIVSAVNVPARESSALYGHSTDRRGHSGWLVAMPCCLWTGWIQRGRGGRRQKTHVTHPREADSARPDPVPADRARNSRFYRPDPDESPAGRATPFIVDDVVDGVADALPRRTRTPADARNPLGRKPWQTRG